MLIKLAQVVKAKGNQLVVKFLQKQQTVDILQTYGFRYNPPVSSGCVLFQVNEREQTQVAVADDPKKDFGNLQSGEVAVGNLLTQSNIKFSQDESITITKGETTIKIDSLGNVSINNATTISLDGNLPIALFDGINTALTTYATEMATSLATGSNSGGTVAFATPPPTQINISSAKSTKVTAI